MFRHYEKTGYLLAFFAISGLVLSWKFFFASQHPMDTDDYRKRLDASSKSIFTPVDAGKTDDSLRVYTVDVVGLPAFKSPSMAFGVYLGEGFILTAAHVVGRYPLAASPRVLIAGKDLPAKVIKLDSQEQIDLALLIIDQQQLPMNIRMRRNPLCKMAIAIGTDVIVVNPDTAARSRVISPALISSQVRTKFSTLTSSGFPTGSAVFHADKKCLLGIMSREIPKYSYGNKGGRLTITSNGYAGYFVPSSLIVNLSPATFGF